MVLFGATGKLGGFLQTRWVDQDEVTAPGRAEVDLQDAAAVAEFLGNIDFDVLVNCAAMASPDQCEEAPEEARAVNAVAPAVMARACREQGARMVHFSTDYVLAGERAGAKDEKEPAGPVNVYGQTKWEGEQAVLAADEDALVCRVSWIFGTDPPGFCDSILARARAGEDLEAIADKFSMPTRACCIAEWIEYLIPRREHRGIFHLTHTGEPQSWWSYGSRVLEMAHELGLLAEPVAIRPTRMADLGLFKAARPIHTAMIPRRLREETSLEIRPWDEEVRRHLRKESR